MGQPQPPGTALHAASRIWSCFLAQTPTFPGAGRRREHTWLTPSACAGPTSGSGRAAPCSSRCFALLLCFPEVHFRPAIGGDEAVTGAGSAPRRGVWQRGTKQCPGAAQAARGESGPAPEVGVGQGWGSVTCRHRDERCCVRICACRRALRHRCWAWRPSPTLALDSQACTLSRLQEGGGDCGAEASPVVGGAQLNLQQHRGGRHWEGIGAEAPALSPVTKTARDHVKSSAGPTRCSSAGTGGCRCEHNFSRCCWALWELEGCDLSVSLWLLRTAPTLLPAGSGLLLICRQLHRCPSCCGKRPGGLFPAAA